METKKSLDFLTPSNLRSRESLKVAGGDLLKGAGIF